MKHYINLFLVLIFLLPANIFAAERCSSISNIASSDSSDKNLILPALKDKEIEDVNYPAEIPSSLCLSLQNSDLTLRRELYNSFNSSIIKVEAFLLSGEINEANKELDSIPPEMKPSNQDKIEINHILACSALNIFYDLVEKSLKELFIIVGAYNKKIIDPIKTAKKLQLAAFSSHSSVMPVAPFFLYLLTDEQLNLFISNANTLCISPEEAAFFAEVFSRKMTLIFESKLLSLQNSNGDEFEKIGAYILKLQKTILPLDVALNDPFFERNIPRTQLFSYDFVKKVLNYMLHSNFSEGVMQNRNFETFIRDLIAFSHVEEE